MQTRDAILKRRSIRKYKDLPVEAEKIEALLEAADAAPSACNKRPLRFYVIKNPEILRRLSESGRFTSFSSPLAERTITGIRSFDLTSATKRLPSLSGSPRSSIIKSGTCEKYRVLAIA